MCVITANQPALSIKQQMTHVLTCVRAGSLTATHVVRPGKGEEWAVLCGAGWVWLGFVCRGSVQCGMMHGAHAWCAPAGGVVGTCGSTRRTNARLTSSRIGDVGEGIVSMQTPTQKLCNLTFSPSLVPPPLLQRRFGIPIRMPLRSPTTHATPCQSAATS
jgi:hypothetical protein